MAYFCASFDSCKEMLFKLTPLLLLFLLSIGSTLAQQSPNATLMGTVMNCKPGSFTQIEVDKRHLDNRFDVYDCEIGEGGKFGLKIHLYLPQLVKLKYMNTVYEFFMQPNDSLVITIDRMSPSTIDFAGRGSLDNKCLKSYRSQFYEESNEFSMRYYRQGTYNYRISEIDDNEMQMLDPENFSSKRRRELLRKKDFLNAYMLEGQSKPTQAFVNYLVAEMEYKYALSMLAYGQVYRVFHKIDDRFFDFINNINLNNPKNLGNPYFRNFLEANSSFFNEKTSPNSTKPFSEQYEAVDLLITNDTVKWWHKAIILKKAVGKNLIVEMVPLYDEFIRNNPFEEYDRLVVDAFQAANKLAPGSEAPNFNLTDINGKPVSLKDFRGKAVYVDFWATWCRPCIQKMQEMKDFEEKIIKEKKEIAFIHISLDGEADKWQKHVQANDYPGVHLISAAGTNGGVATSYEVKAVPKFYIIDKNGRFATQLKSSEPEAIREALINLTY